MSARWRAASSPAGDYIGQGKTFLDTPPAYSIAAQGSQTAVTLRIQNPADVSDYWYVDMDARYNQTALTTGFYPNVQRANSVYNPATGGFAVWLPGRACNRDLSSFAVDQISFDAQGLASIAVRFTQSCEGTMPALYGALRWTRP